MPIKREYTPAVATVALHGPRPRYFTPDGPVYPPSEAVVAWCGARHALETARAALVNAENAVDAAHAAECAAWQAIPAGEKVEAADEVPRDAAPAQAIKNLSDADPAAVAKVLASFGPPGAP